MILAAWYHTIAAVFFAVLGIWIIIVILLQRGKGVGLAGAFGGAGGHTAFGAKTGDVLTWVTIASAVAFLLLAIVLNYLFVPVTPTGVGGGAPPAGAIPPAGPAGGQQSSWAPEEAGTSPVYAGLPVFGSDEA
jgi:preprotein translocase subunit SecG